MALRAGRGKGRHHRPRGTVLQGNGSSVGEYRFLCDCLRIAWTGKKKFETETRVTILVTVCGPDNPGNENARSGNASYEITAGLMRCMNATV